MPPRRTERAHETVVRPLAQRRFVDSQQRARQTEGQPLAVTDGIYGFVGQDSLLAMHRVTNRFL